MLSAFISSLRTPDLRRKILFTLGMLAVYRIGVFVTTPGVDLTTWESWWLYNRDAYLDLKVHIEASQPQSGLNAATASADAWDQVGERVMPELLATLEDDVGRTCQALLADAQTIRVIRPASGVKRLAVKFIYVSP